MDMRKLKILSCLTEEDISRIEKNVPQEMLDTNNWCYYLYARNIETGKIEKIPCDANGKFKKGAPIGFMSKLSFDDVATPSTKVSGLGFAIRPPFGAWDIDHCLVERKLTDPTVWNDLERMSSYTEVSPSHTGLHVFFEAEEPEWVKCQKNGDYELYFHGRFMTVTGLIGKSFHPPFRTVDEEAIKQIYMRMDPDFETKKTHERRGSDGTTSSSSSRAFVGKEYEGDVGSVDDIIKRLKSYAKSSKLFEGDWELVTTSDGNLIPSHSEADLMLVHFSAFHAKYDWELTDLVFRASGLYRDDKWDTFHGKLTYGELTLLKDFSTSHHEANIPKEVYDRVNY